MTRRTERRERELKALAQYRTLTLPAIPQIEVRDAVRALMQAEADRPMRGGNADLQHAGLFGDAHKQQQLF